MTSLTPASLLSYLERLSVAESGPAGEQLLVSAAAMLQDAVSGGACPATLDSAIDSVPSQLQKYLRTVLDRAVNFHSLPGYGTLGLWLLPVVVGLDNAAWPGVLPLEQNSLNQLKLAGCLTKQLGLGTCISPDAAANASAGWNYIIPALYSLEQITAADLESLVGLPLQARAVVRGEKSAVVFDCGPAEEPVVGECLYFLPIIALHPVGRDIRLPVASSVVSDRLATWVSTTVREANAGRVPFVEAASMPRSYSMALDAGELFKLDVQLRSTIASLTRELAVQPLGMSALIAPYEMAEGKQCVLGITLVSRMTEAVLAALTISVLSDGVEEGLQAVQSLRSVGLENVEFHTQTLKAPHCADRGELVFALPSKTTMTGQTHVAATAIQ